MDCEAAKPYSLGDKVYYLQKNITAGSEIVLANHIGEFFTTITDSNCLIQEWEVRDFNTDAVLPTSDEIAVRTF